jgi:hypothetical protein
LVPFHSVHVDDHDVEAAALESPDDTRADGEGFEDEVDAAQRRTTLAYDGRDACQSDGEDPLGVDSHADAEGVAQGEMGRERVDALERGGEPGDDNDALLETVFSDKMGEPLLFSIILDVNVDHLVFTVTREVTESIFEGVAAVAFRLRQRLFTYNMSLAMSIGIPGVVDEEELPVLRDAVVHLDLVDAARERLPERCEGVLPFPEAAAAVRDDAESLSRQCPHR